MTSPLIDRLRAAADDMESIRNSGFLIPAKGDLDRWSDVLRSAADALSAQEWRTIDSAPKDGTHILVRTADEGIGTAFWWGYGNCPQWRTCFGSEEFLNPGTIDGEPLLVNPTHWMPLPPSPDGKEKGE